MEPNYNNKSYQANQLNTNRNMNHQVIIGKEMPIRLSGSKFQFIKNQQLNFGVSNLKHRQKKALKESLYKLNSSLESQGDNNNNSDLYSTSNLRKEGQENQISSIAAAAATYNPPMTEEKNQSFLPRLDANHRYSNSQVQYRDQTDINRSDYKDKSDMNIKSPTNNETINMSNKKTSYSQERKNSQNYQNLNDFNKVFSAQNSLTKGQKLNKANNQSNLQNTSGNLFNEISPKSNLKDFSELYQIKNGIGKVQPVPEIKTQFNEQVIRGKIYREKNLNSETPSKLDMNLISISKNSVSNNYHQNRNHSNGPISEVVSPKHVIESPLYFQFDPHKPVKIDPSVNHTKYMLKNFSASQGSQQPEEKFTSEKLHQQMAQYNTQESINLMFYRIEDVVRTSIQEKVVAPLSKSGVISIPENRSSHNDDHFLLQNMSYIPLSIEKKAFSSKIPSTYSGSEQLNTSQLTLQKQFHHTIKTLASKQMPKCFRMSKHQIQLIDRHQNKGANTSIIPNNKFQLLENNQNSNKFDQTFLVQKLPIQYNQRSMSNDARVSFNNDNQSQYSTIQRVKAEFQTPARQSYKFNSNLFNEDSAHSHGNAANNGGGAAGGGGGAYNTTGKFNSDQLEFDHERMTPAFNARQSYIGRLE